MCLKESKQLASLLIKNGMTVTTAESCTGGLIAHAITALAGSSAYFKGSVVSYCDEVKHRVLGVSAEDLEKHTAVSLPVAEQMAQGVRELMQTDISVATTGIAGPTGGTSEQPVGTVWISAASARKQKTECFHFNGGRQEVIEAAARQALQMAIDIIGK